MPTGSRLDRLNAKAAQIADANKEERRLLVQAFRKIREQSRGSAKGLDRDAALQRSIDGLSANKIRRIYLTEQRAKVQACDALAVQEAES